MKEMIKKYRGSLICSLLYNGIARLVNMGADMENLFMAVIYYGTGLLFMVIGNRFPVEI